MCITTTLGNFFVFVSRQPIACQRIIGFPAAKGVLRARAAPASHQNETGQNDALVLPTEIFREEFKKAGAFQNSVLKHVQALSAISSQVALCNRLHSVERRLSRWLLLVHDRLGDKNLELTHEFLAMMVGSRRAGVTEAAGMLREAGLIDYTRGSILILGRPGLEKTACERYEIKGNHFNYAIS